MGNSIMQMRIDEIERLLVDVLRRKNADSESGCSALFNVLAASFVRLLKDPDLAPAVRQEMRRAAAKLVDLAGAPVSALDVVVREGRAH